MARGDKTKEQAFKMWQSGKTLEEIQKAVCQNTSTKPGSVRGWILDWERGRQNSWDPDIQ